MCSWRWALPPRGLGREHEVEMSESMGVWPENRNFSHKPGGKGSGLQAAVPDSSFIIV